MKTTTQKHTNVTILILIASFAILIGYTALEFIKLGIYSR